MQVDSVARSGAFRIIWIGDFGARLGYQISFFLLPLMVTLVLQESGTKVGLVTAAQFVPVIALSLGVGTWVNRVRLRRVLVISNLVRGLPFVCVGALYAQHALQFWQLFLVAVIIGAAGPFYDIGMQVAVPRFFTGQRLISANGLLQASTSITQMAGPAAAGYLVQAAGFSLASVLTAALLIGAGCVFAGLDGTRLMPMQGRGTRTTIRAGLRFTWRCRPIRDLCTQSALFNLHEQAFLTVFLLFGIRSLGLTGGTVGTLIGLGSVGALVGSLVTGRFGARIHLGLLLTCSIFAASVGLLLVPVLSALHAPVFLLGAGFVLNGLTLAAYNVIAITVRQEIPPSELLGSVTASYRIMVFGLAPVGALVGGMLADAFGPGAALWTVSISLLCCSVVIFFSPLRAARHLAQVRVMAAPALPDNARSVT